MRLMATKRSSLVSVYNMAIVNNLVGIQAPAKMYGGSPAETNGKIASHMHCCDNQVLFGMTDNFHILTHVCVAYLRAFYPSVRQPIIQTRPVRREADMQTGGVRLLKPSASTDKPAKGEQKYYIVLYL